MSGSPDNPIWSALEIRLEDRRSVGKAFQKSAQKSIDLFLIKRARHDPDQNRGELFLRIGKIAIAIVIMSNEIEGNLFFQPGERKWYEILWQRMDAIPPEVGREFDKMPSEFAKNNVSFVSFNYDRSLEYSLFHHIQATYGLDDDMKVGQILGNLRFYHVHGQLAQPHFFKLDNVLPYGAEPTPQNIRRAVDNIQLVGEKGEYNAQILLTGIREKLINADEVVFLGFGYANENLELLSIGPLWKSGHIGGTFYGMELGERVTVGEYFENLGRQIIGARINDNDDVYTFVRKWDFLKPFSPPYVP